MKKFRYIGPVVLAATAAAIGLAPVAAAAPSACVYQIGSTVCESPGNAQVTTQPGATALQAGELQYPFFGYGWLPFHHGGHR
jgi:hypothetical protein